jgi:DNA helicase HerA-like ATPase
MDGPLATANAALSDGAARAPASPDQIGRVSVVGGAQATVELHPRAVTGEQPTVGKFMGMVGGKGLMIGLITEVAEEPLGGSGLSQYYRNLARLDLIGEIQFDSSGSQRFQRGITEYPNIGDGAKLLNDAELSMIYGAADNDHAHIGDLQQNPDIGVQIDIDHLVSRHFAVLGATGVGKSSGVAIILQQILATRPNLRIFLVDPHNEYGPCFGDKAQVLTPRNLRLPFWLFNFEEIVDVFFGARPGVEEEVEILADVIPLAKSAYLQYKAGPASPLSKRKDPRDAGFTADTPVPYRIEDLLNVLDERMGKLENRTSRVTYHRLISRIQTIRNHPRYAFMFENANIGGDTMADILSHLFRLPPQGVPMTILQLAGFPAEVIDSVVSVLCRMAFDFGLWSDGVAPLLFVCEEAHRYAPADKKIGFGPTRRALSRIAKEGRKYGVFLGLVTQRPAEIDPTIISQCSTFFVMRLANDRDQHLIRSAVSDAAANLLSFIPSLGTREVFTFGQGVAMPTRMRFKELPPDVRPNSEASGNTRSDGGNTLERELIGAVIERWRSASMSQRSDELAADFSSLEAPPLQPVAPPPIAAPAPAVLAPTATAPAARPPQAPLPTAPAPAARVPQSPPPPQSPRGPQTPPPSSRGEALRSSLLRKPLDVTVGAGAPAPAPRPAPAPGGTPQNVSPPGYPPRLR